MDIQAILMVVLAVAVAVERTAEIVKPLYLNLKNKLGIARYTECTKTEKVIITVLLGPIMCVVGGLNLGITEPPLLIQSVLMGLIASLGSNTIHALLSTVVAVKDAAEGIKRK